MCNVLCDGVWLVFVCVVFVRACVKSVGCSYFIVWWCVRFRVCSLRLCACVCAGFNEGVDVACDLLCDAVRPVCCMFRVVSCVYVRVVTIVLMCVIRL